MRAATSNTSLCTPRLWIDPQLLHSSIIEQQYSNASPFTLTLHPYPQTAVQLQNLKKNFCGHLGYVQVGSAPEGGARPGQNPVCACPVRQFLGGHRPPPRGLPSAACIKNYSLFELFARLW